MIFSTESGNTTTSESKATVVLEKHEHLTIRLGINIVKVDHRFGGWMISTNTNVMVEHSKPGLGNITLDEADTSPARVSGGCALNDQAVALLARSFFAVEANSFERMSLWKECAKKSSARDGTAVEWEDISGGGMVTVGQINKCPVNIEMFWARIEGRVVMFWNACSRAVDHAMIEKWLETNAPWWTGHHTDAMNFGNCLSAIQRSNGVQS